MRRVGLTKTLLVVALVAIVASLYCYGAVRHLRESNTKMTRTDQRKYLGYAKKIHKLIYEDKPFYGDGARMPLYPFLQSLVYDPDLTEEEFFVRGKYFNIVLSLVMLACLFFIFRKYLSLLHTVTLLLVIAYTIFMFKAAYFHAALLFYFLIFCAFLLMCKMLVNPSWKLGVLTGFVLGVTQLTKSAVLPALGLFAFFHGAKALRALYAGLANRARASTPSPHPHLMRELATRLLSIALVVVVFLGTVYPYISTSKRVYGKYFYCVSTTFYMWYDSWDEVKQGTRAHGDRKGWPDLPPEEIPSFSKYMREHTAQQILDRIVSGLEQIHSGCTDSFGYYKYFWIYLAFLLLVVALNPRHSARLAGRYPFLLLFCLSFFTVYLLGYAWYMAIQVANRLVLALFIPVVFSASYAAFLQPPQHLSIRRLGMRVKLLDVFNVLVLCVLAVDMYFIMTDRIVTMYAGT